MGFSDVSIEKMEKLQKVVKMPPDASKFRTIGRGYIDWKFSQLCEYLGYDDALKYVDSLTRRTDRENILKSTLITTFRAFFEELNRVVEDLETGI